MRYVVRYSLLFLFLLVAAIRSTAQQDSILIEVLLQRIAAQQATQNSFYSKGVFPSYIANHPHFSAHKKDNNIFFTALIDYTLGKLANKQFIDPSAYDSVHALAAAAYPFFINKKGRITYNFWRTDSVYTFPYTWWIAKVKKNTALPDDLDDTVLSLLAQDADSATAAAVHNYMQQFTSSYGKNAKVMDKQYRRYAAYSVWYGKHFPVVLDVSVLCNVLLFVQYYNLAWTAADSACLQVITAAISNNDITQHPLSVSPYYGSVSVILYHLARLMSSKPIESLEAHKTQLIAIALYQFNHTINPLEKAILCTALMRWGYAPPYFQLPAVAAVEHNNLPFFVGNIPSYFPAPVRRIFMRKGWGLFYHYCPAYNDVLLLEYLLLKNAVQ